MHGGLLCTAHFEIIEFVALKDWEQSMYVGESENNNQSKWLSFGITEHSGHTLLNQKVVPKNESEQDMTVVEVYQD